MIDFIQSDSTLSLNPSKNLHGNSIFSDFLGARFFHFSVTLENIIAVYESKGIFLRLTSERGELA